MMMPLKGEVNTEEEVDPASLLKQIDRQEDDGQEEGEPVKRKCNFCGKEQKDVKTLIAAEGENYICNECIGLCNEILYEQSGDIPGQINLFVRTVNGREQHLVADMATKSLRWVDESSMNQDPNSLMYHLLKDKGDHTHG
jgi:hypothetical protein